MANNRGKSQQGFLQKTYEIFNTSQWSHLCGWDSEGKTIIIYDVDEFCEQVLPSFFKHKNIQSFVRQLNMYDFHKTCENPSDQCFTHPHFRRGQPELLEYIKRKVNVKSQKNNKDSEDDIGTNPIGSNTGSGGGNGSYKSRKRNTNPKSKLSKQQRELQDQDDYDYDYIYGDNKNPLNFDDNNKNNSNKIPKLSHHHVTSSSNIPPPSVGSTRVGREIKPVNRLMDETSNGSGGTNDNTTNDDTKAINSIKDNSRLRSTKEKFPFPRGGMSTSTAGDLLHMHNRDQMIFIGDQLGTIKLELVYQRQRSNQLVNLISQMIPIITDIDPDNKETTTTAKSKLISELNNWKKKEEELVLGNTNGSSGGLHEENAANSLIRLNSLTALASDLVPLDTNRVRKGSESDNSIWLGGHSLANTPSIAGLSGISNTSLGGLGSNANSVSKIDFESRQLSFGFGGAPLQDAAAMHSFDGYTAENDWGRNKAAAAAAANGCASGGGGGVGTNETKTVVKNDEEKNAISAKADTVTAAQTQQIMLERIKAQPNFGAVK